MRRTRRNGPKEDAQRFLTQSPWPKDIAHLEDWLVAAAEAGDPAAEAALEALMNGTRLEALWQQYQRPPLHAIDVDLDDSKAVNARVKKLLDLRELAAPQVNRNFFWEAAQLLSAWFRHVIEATDYSGVLYSHSQLQRWMQLGLVPSADLWTHGWIIFTEEQAYALGDRLDEPFYHYIIYATTYYPAGEDEDGLDPETNEVDNDVVDSLEALDHIADDFSEWSNWPYPDPGSWRLSDMEDDYTTGTATERSLHFWRGNEDAPHGQERLSYVEMATLKSYKSYGIEPLEGKWTPPQEYVEAYNAGVAAAAAKWARPILVGEGRVWWCRGLYYGQAMRELESRVKEDTE